MSPRLVTGQAPVVISETIRQTLETSAEHFKRT